MDMAERKRHDGKYTDSVHLTNMVERKRQDRKHTNSVVPFPAALWIWLREKDRIESILTVCTSQSKHDSLVFLYRHLLH